MTTMSLKARQKANDYQREWRRKNPDKVRQYAIDFWERKTLEENATLEERVVELTDQGYSLREIGRKLGISHMKVQRMLQACNDCNKDVE